MEIILASQSPRRKQILESEGYDITVCPSDFDERSVKIDDLKELVLELAKQKALIVAKDYPNSIILAADTMVYFQGKEIGQIEDPAEAKDVLRSLMGKTHEVFTGVCVMKNKTILQDLVISKVTLKTVSDDILNSYVDSGLYKGKAGAYNIDDP